MAKTHGLSKTKVYESWLKLRTRCNSKNHHAYKYYGGRGIGYDPRWNKFEDFILDMGIPEDGMTIERIDINKDYSKNNCRWASRKEQSRNRSSNVIIEIENEKNCISYFAEKFNFPQSVAQSRYRKGVPNELIFKSGLVYKKNGSWINKEDWCRPKREQKNKGSKGSCYE